MRLDKPTETETLRAQLKAANQDRDRLRAELALRPAIRAAPPRSDWDDYNARRLSEAEEWLDEVAHGDETDEEHPQGDGNAARIKWALMSLRETTDRLRADNARLVEREKLLTKTLTRARRWHETAIETIELADPDEDEIFHAREFLKTIDAALSPAKEGG